MFFGSDKDTFSDDDMFAETRMSFGEHIEVLRRHLIKAFVGLFIALCASFAIAQPVLEYINAPVQHELVEAYKRRLTRVHKKIEEEDRATGTNAPQALLVTVSRNEAAKLVGVEPKFAEDDRGDLTLTIRPLDIVDVSGPINQMVLRPPTLVALSATEGLMVYLKVALYCAIVLSSWWIFYQLWSFVAAGLYPNEKRLVNVYLPVSVVLFLVGVAVCEFVVLPKAVHYLIAFNEWLDIESELRLTDWLSFAIMMPLVFGAAFQTPLVMLFLEQIGVMDIERYRKYRRIAYFVLAIVAVILTPSPDAFSYLSLTVPLWFLYELGILFCRFMPRRARGEDAPEPDEMVEV